MASGVNVDQGCVETYQQLKLGKKLKYIIFTLNKENTSIIVEKTSESEDYDDFVGDLPESECKWAIYDLRFEKEGAPRSKLVFYSWSPDTAKIKQKMVFASSRDALRRSLVGIGVEIQGTDSSEVAHEAVLEKANRAAR
ncbi:actin depolymerizing factor [Amanita muscaria]